MQACNSILHIYIYQRQFSNCENRSRNNTIFVGTENFARNLELQIKKIILVYDSGKETPFKLKQNRTSENK
jgi:hypothetical protein